MADEKKDGDTQSTQTATTQAAAPAIDVEAITRKAAELATAGIDKKIQEVAQQATEAERGRMAKALGLTRDNEVNEQVLEQIIKDPVRVLANVGTVTQQAVLEQIDKKLSDFKKSLSDDATQGQAISRAVTSTLAQRPDLASNEEALTIVKTFFYQQDEKLSVDDRIKAAVTEYDRLLEKAGAGKKEERVKAATVLTSTSTANPQSQAKTTEQARQESVKDNLDAFAKKRGGRLPNAFVS